MLQTATNTTRHRRVANASRNAVNLGQDRLSHAKNFANELSESRLREMAERHRQRWTPEKRTEKAQIIQNAKP